MDSYKKACKCLGSNLSNSQTFATILQWAAFRYNVEEYNIQVEIPKEKSERAHQLLLSYKVENWANTFFLE